MMALFRRGPERLAVWCREVGGVEGWCCRTLCWEVCCGEFGGCCGHRSQVSGSERVAGVLVVVV